MRETHLRDYWKIVWQGRWTALAIFFVVLGYTAVSTFLRTPIYRATATVEVQPQAKRLAAGQDVSGLGAAGYGWFAEEKYHNTQVEIIKSRDVAERAVDQLDLRSHQMFAENPDPAGSFRRMIEAVPRRDTGLIEISLTGTDPDEVAHWVNGVAEAYVRRNLDKAQETMNDAILRIREQLEDLEEDFQTREESRFSALSSEAEGSRIVNTEEQEEIIHDKLRTYNKELSDVQIELTQLGNSLQQIRDMPARGADLLSLPELADDPTLKELHSSKVDLERELESAKVQLREGHPLYEGKVSELAKVEQRISDRIAVNLGTLQTRYNLALDKESYLKKEIRRAEDYSLEIGRASSEYERVKSEAETMKHLVEVVSKTMQEVTLGQEFLTNNVSVLDRATPPMHPIKPRKRQNLLIGALVGMFLGVAAAFFLDYLDNTFRTPEDIEKFLGATVLGVIPKLGSEGTLGRAVREAYQSLRTSVIFSSKNRQRKVILVTSTGPQEGKSSTVSNLARALAAAGDRVIVVDCDLRRPTQHVAFELDRDHGMTNYLAAPVESTDWSVYIKTAGPPNLHVMTCGPIPPSPPELLGTDRFTELLDSIKSCYDWVLIDSPPAGSLADASLLAARAEMVILVVQHNRTDRDLVAKTLQRLTAVNSTLAGAVLNNVDLERAYNKDYYYAGYYYYGDDGETRAKKKRRVEPSVKVG
jgi:capsular exopolysaccharide synthesis family protein